jgi:hypothetical protein
MTHDEIQDLLEGYVDETLDRATRREVDAHLATCDECRAVLEGVAPVDLGEVSGTWDARGMRRAVRRSMLRVAGDALLILFAAWLGAWLLSLLVLQPLVLNRGGRAVAATVATVDLAIMSHPGVVLTEYSYRSQWISRTTEVRLSLPVGSGLNDVGTVESRIGPVGFGSPEGGRLSPSLLDEYTSDGQDDEMLRVVDEGTVATVRVRFDDTVDVETAQGMVDTDADVSVIWSGFDVAGVEGSDLAPTGVLGYVTCGSPSLMVSDAAGSSGGGSGSFHGAPASVTGALEETRRAVGNLVDHPELLDGIGAGIDDATSAIERLESPQVREMVVTGPTPEILEFVDQVEPGGVSVIEIDFTNWSEPPCAR